MVIKLHIFRGSPPCRAVMITAKALGINLEIIIINPAITDSPNLENLSKVIAETTNPSYCFKVV